MIGKVKVIGKVVERADFVIWIKEITRNSSRDGFLLAIPAKESFLLSSSSTRKFSFTKMLGAINSKNSFK